jgi:hypothetical protein
MRYILSQQLPIDPTKAVRPKFKTSRRTLTDPKRRYGSVQKHRSLIVRNRHLCTVCVVVIHHQLGQFAMSIMTWADSIVEVGTGEANHNVQQGAIETTSSGICRQSGACPECGQRTQVARDV